MKQLLRLFPYVRHLENELERERLRLAACGVAALGYFDGCAPEYESASLRDVLRLRAQINNQEPAQSCIYEARSRDGGSTEGWCRTHGWDCPKCQPKESNMKRIAVILALVVVAAGCSSTRQPEPPPDVVTSEPAPGDRPVQRLIRDTLEIDRNKLSVETMRKEKRLTPPQARELAVVLKMAEESIREAHNAHLSGDVSAFDRAMDVTGELLEDLRQRFASIESERKLAEAERRAAGKK